MNRSELKKVIREIIINEKKNDFVATAHGAILSIHNSSDEAANEKMYYELVKFIKKYKPKKIDITF